jgi:hypothetical protein
LPATVGLHYFTATFFTATLPGRANVDTVPATGIPLHAKNLGLYHPASYIKVGVIRLPDGVTAPPRGFQPTSPNRYVAVKTITVQGHPATAWYMKRGLGGINIGWLQDGDYVSVQTSRGTTPDGLSGVSLRQLEKVAQGVRIG